jgi:KaiC/GvpD/RAD55 family RecA-like ATPase
MKSGMPGFDKLCGGGIPRGISTILAGSSGSGKTTFATQILYNGITKYKENGVFVTLEITPKKMFEFTKNFGWDLKKLVDEDRLIMVTLDPFQMHKFSGSDALISLLLEKIKDYKVRRVVLDSLDIFNLLFSDPFDRRVAIHNLVTKLQSVNCNLIMISELDTENVDVNVEDLPTSVVDSIILLYYLRQGNVRQRAIEILKIRGIEHDKGMRPFRITNKGVKVYPGEKIFR